MNPMLNLWLIPMLPLAGAAINGFLGKKSSRSAVTTVALFFSGAAFAMALWVALRFSSPTLPYHEYLVHWIRSGNFSVDFAFYLDQLSLVMLLVVTGVGFLIHIYSVGYIWEDPSYYRFFSYLNLFMFFMVTLVLANNYLVMFIGWEGVGLATYLLIGFWFTKDSAGSGGKKAFILNRIGDFGFLIALFLLIKHFGSLNFEQVFQSVAPLSPETAGTGLLTAIGILLMVGACGKSAQIPLYVWLPDAMEGPTPVSALIHAATMVTAGVYMVARSHVIFERAPSALMVVAIIGTLTAFFAATIGIAQTDIKKVLAYSTISQLGYMFMACGVGAFSAGIFHLMTHAFFKGLLFLAAGSVIHAVSGEQDMTKMGALAKKIPTTYRTMLVATLAIAGIPPLAGFFSKDEILEKAFERSPALWVVGWITAGMTAFYMFRLIFMTFHGTSRVDHEAEHHIHESPKSMLVPLVILAALSIVGGWVSWPEIFGGNSHFINFLSTVVAVPHEARMEPLKGASSRLGELHLMLLSEGLVILGILFAWYLYVKRTDLPAKIAKAFGGFYRLVYNKNYVDQPYDGMFVNRAKDLGLALGAFDRNVIDGVGVNGAGWLTRFISNVSIWWDTWIVDGSVRLGARIVWVFSYPVRRVQDGLVQSYMLLIVLGLIGLDRK